MESIKKSMVWKYLLNGLKENYLPSWCSQWLWYHGNYCGQTQTLRSLSFTSNLQLRQRPKKEMTSTGFHDQQQSIFVFVQHKTRVVRHKKWQVIYWDFPKPWMMTQSKLLGYTTTLFAEREILAKPSLTKKTTHRSIFGHLSFVRISKLKSWNSFAGQYMRCVFGCMRVCVFCLPAHIYHKHCIMYGVCCCVCVCDRVRVVIVCAWVQNLKHLTGSAFMHRSVCAGYVLQFPM